MSNFWIASGSSDIIAPTLGNVLSSSVSVSSENVKWSSATGYWFSQAASTGLDRELGVYRLGSDLEIKAGGNTLTLDFATVFGVTSLECDLLEYVHDMVTGDVSISVDGAEVLSANFATGLNRTDGCLFRIGSRGSSDIAGSTTSAYFLASGDEIGDTDVSIDGVLVRSYVMPITGIAVPDTTSSLSGVLQNPSGSDWGTDTPVAGIYAPSIIDPIYAIGTDGLCAVEFEGGYSGITPTLIEYRVMKGVSEVLTWTSVDSFGSDAFLFTPPISPNTELIFEFRTTVAAAEYTAASSVFDVGPVMGIVGSSSAERYFTNGTGTLTGKMHVKETGTWSTSEAGETITGGSSVALANIITAGGWPVGFYAYGVGGDQLTDQWLVPNGSSYASFISAVADSNISAIYNQLGINDVRVGVAITQTDISDLLAGFRSNFGPIPYIDGGIQRHTSTFDSIFVDAWAATVAESIAEPDYYISWRQDLEIGTDDLHLTEAASVLGAQRAGVIMDALFSTGTYVKGPSISSASFVDDTISIALDQAGSDYSAITPLTGLGGFRVTDGNGTATLLSQTVESSTELEIVADADLVAPVTIEFAAWNSNVFNTRVATDYALVDSTVVMPLQPLVTAMSVVGITLTTDADEYSPGETITGSTTGLSTITTATLSRGAVSLDLGINSDTEWLIPDFTTSDQQAQLFSDPLVTTDLILTVGDGTDTATKVLSLNPKTGYEQVTYNGITGTPDILDSNYIPAGSSVPTIVDGDQIRSLAGSPITYLANGATTYDPADLGTSYTELYTWIKADTGIMHNVIKNYLSGDPVDTPVLAGTLTLSGTIGQTFSRTLSIQSGSPATSWDIVGGADQANYTLSDAGALARTVDQDLVESEVIEVTATNSAGTSNTQTITINYTKGGLPLTKYRQMPWYPHRKKV